jgi:hypothetical protein
MTKPLALTLAVFLSVAAVHAFDWPQWQGPDRNRTSKETGLLPEWPSGGPRVLWTANSLGRGYGSKGRFQIPDRRRMSWAHPAISDGRLYVRNQDTLLVYDIKATAQ